MSLSHREIVGEMLTDAVDYARAHDVSDDEVKETLAELLAPADE